mmetsp:Transcript_39142/g.121362  ORF Transcript_39142/g.121362 Transcript_39142/m.121362 type:complete len:270 (-) Transcript_39142:1474-2283(-)
MILMSATSAMSASRCCFLGGWPERRQARRKALPMFLLGLPKNSLMQECTTPAMRLTKTMTWSSKTSVASVKLRMSQKPKMASTLRPGIMAFSVELFSPFMFWPMISAPASPKPRASKEPILTMVFSRTTVSMGSGACLGAALEQHARTAEAQRPSRPARACGGETETSCVGCGLRLAATCSRCRSSSPIVRAASGSFLILSILAIIRSIGVSTNRLASLENVMAPKPKRKQMKRVWAVFSRASILEPLRRSKTNMKYAAFHSGVVAMVG